MHQKGGGDLKVGGGEIPVKLKTLPNVFLF